MIEKGRWLRADKRGRSSHEEIVILLFFLSLLFSVHCMALSLLFFVSLNFSFSSLFLLQLHSRTRRAQSGGRETSTTSTGLGASWHAQKSHAAGGEEGTAATEVLEVCFFFAPFIVCFLSYAVVFSLLPFLLFVCISHPVFFLTSSLVYIRTEFKPLFRYQ